MVAYPHWLIRPQQVEAEPAGSDTGGIFFLSSALRLTVPSHYRLPIIGPKIDTKAAAASKGIYSFEDEPIPALARGRARALAQLELRKIEAPAQ